jgi:predicted nucleic acid-binding protein
VTVVVIDASAIVACAIANGKARRTVLTAVDVEFCAPAFVLEEVRRRLPKFIALSGVAPAILTTLLDDLFGRISVVPREGYLNRLAEATALAARAGAQGDEEYIALALALEAPVWSYDKDFHRVRGIRVIGREQIELRQFG